MLNTEIGTYSICEAIVANPYLKVKIENNQLIARVNGRRLVGNKKVIFSVVDTKNLQVRKSVMDNDIVIKKTPMQVMDDVFGLSTDNDYKIVYDKDEVWRQAKHMATDEVRVIIEDKFKLDGDGEI